MSSSHTGDTLAPSAGLTDRLGFLLKHAQHRLVEQTNAALEPFDVDGRDWAVMEAVAAHGPTGQRDIGRRMGVDRTTMVALLDSLEERGLVKRSPHPGDGRANVVALTATGKRRLSEVRHVGQQAQARFLAPLDASEREQLVSSLKRLLGR
jgi:DNA-binding MarR family transcriptional regulator